MKDTVVGAVTYILIVAGIGVFFASAGRVVESVSMRRRNRARDHRANAVLTMQRALEDFSAAFDAELSSYVSRSWDSPPTMDDILKRYPFLVNQAKARYRAGPRQILRHGRGFGGVTR